MEIKRKIIVDIREHLFQKEITILTGPRQIGKTTLMQELVKDVTASGKKYLWLDLDTEEDYKHLKTQQKLITKISLEFGKEGGVVFIDEIQRKENAGLFIKGIYDHQENIKFVLSGSGSMELKEKIVESLAGRKRIFSMSPVSFDEFVDFKTNYRYSDRLADFKTIEVEKTRNFFEEYILFGGYPKIVTTAKKDRKITLLKEILNSYLNKDIKTLLAIAKYNEFNQLFKIISQQVGSPTKYTSLSQYVAVSSGTIKEYIWYLENTFMIRQSIPFYTNPLKEIVKEPVLYYYDMGMLNLQRNNFFPEINTPSFGMTFQNFIFNELTTLFNNDNAPIKYWRTKEKAEVDIIIELGKNMLIPIEVKYVAFKKPKISRSFYSFLNKYETNIAFIITKEGEFTYKKDKTTIHFLPYNKLEVIRQKTILELS